MSSSSRSKETNFEYGIRRAFEEQEDAKPPRRNSTPILFVYIITFLIFLPGLFMGLGNFIICPFALPDGWSNPTDARSRCDQFGAQKAAVIYTCINIFYGMFIGYATRHLIKRLCHSTREHFAKRKRIYEEGKKSEHDRVVKEKAKAAELKLKSRLKEREKNIHEFMDDRAHLAAIRNDGHISSSSHTEYSSKSSKRSRNGAGKFNNYEPTMHGGLPPPQAAHYHPSSANSMAYTQPQPPVSRAGPNTGHQGNAQPPGRFQQPLPQDNPGRPLRMADNARVGG